MCDAMKRIVLIAIITVLATAGIFAVNPATATFDITAVKDYGNVEWRPSFSYEDLYGSEGDELPNRREIEINPAQLRNSLPLFRVNYITNDSTRRVTMAVTTQPFINDSNDTIDVTYHFSDAVHVKNDDSAEWTTYSPQSGYMDSNEDTVYTQTNVTRDSGKSSPYIYESPSLSLPYDSVKYSLTVAVSFSSEMSDYDLMDLAGTFKLPVTVTIESKD